MKRMNLRKNLNAAVLIAGTIMAASALADTQQGGDGTGMMSGDGTGMMSGDGTGWMGGYGGIWVPILLVAVVAGLVGWIVAQKSKVNRQLKLPGKKQDEKLQMYELY